MSAWIYPSLGNYEKAIEEGKRAVEIDPDFAPGYNNAAWSDVFLNRPGEAATVVQQAIGRGLEGPDMMVLPYYIAFLQRDKAGMERAAARGKEHPGAEDWISNAEAFVLAHAGHVNEARRMSRRAVDLAKQAGQPETAAMYEAGVAVREAFFGNALEARRRATAALQLARGRDVEYGAAFALGLSGDASRTQALTDDLEKRFPEDTFVRFTYVPTLRALLALGRGESAHAIEGLQTAVPYDLGMPGSTNGFFGNLYPVYVRGESYRAAHRGVEAAVEFRKILDHPGIVLADPVGAAARVQLARSLALAGDAARARTAYHDFLTLWKDADAGIPILNQARSEYARLQ